MNKLFLLPGFILLIACGPLDKRRVYEEMVSIPTEGWPAAKSYTFDIPVTDTSKSYDLMLHLRNSGRYEYSNIWLFIESTSPKGNTLKDTFEISLADDLGRWKGRGVGDINNMLVPYKENVLLPVKGVYQVKITQAMREKTLKNVLDLGIRLQVHK